MPQAPHSTIPHNRPRPRRQRGERPQTQKRHPSRREELIRRAQEILAQPLEASPKPPPPASPSSRLNASQGSWIVPLFIGLGIVGVIALLGQLFGPLYVGQETVHFTRPIILSITFPQRIAADGKPYYGLIRFRDAEGDITQVSFEYIEPIRSGPFQYEIQVNGRVEGSFRFSTRCVAPQRTTLRVRLLDAKGHWSLPKDVSFRCVQG